MAEVAVQFTMDAELKKRMEQTCKDMGLNLATAFTMFAVKVTQDRRIPFEVEAELDPFYSEENMARLRKMVEDVDAGRTKLTEHELILVDEYPLI
ncbi:MAG: type II toxin-antitoxin system RelB/DinJ family antitoxin [Spirochaetaceae bacterium]|nr:type II toxin-antitoxin system RelB/DinJ family antitoxin [Spirochaetaceae bacterium]